MNRRYFLAVLSIGSVTTTKLNAFTRTQPGISDELGQFVVLYTSQVGKAVIMQHSMADELKSLGEQLNKWHQQGSGMSVKCLNEMISADLHASRFYEIEGWVITKTEALISAVIVSTVYV